MRKLRNYAMLGLMGLMGTLWIGVTSAYEVTYHPEANVSYTLNGNENFTAGLITITDGNETYTIMDRNLGATSTGVDSSDSYGYYFQWGNNYGFPTAGSVATSSTQVDASGYGPGNYYSSSTFITRSSSPWDRSSVRNDNLWGGVSGTYEAMQGPCPEGYHVPSSGEWLGLSTMLGYNGTYDSVASKQAANSLRNELYLPFAGYRLDSSAGVRNQGTNARYWSSTAYSADYAYTLYFNSAGLRPQDGDDRSYGFSVRCFKNSPYSDSNLLVSFWDENGENEIWSGEVGSGNTLYTHVDSGNLVENLSGHAATKPGYMLSGWYDSDADVWYDIDNPITTGLSFRAVWNKYYTIYFDENEGTEVLNQNVIENNTGIRPADPEKFKYTFSDWYDNPELEGEPFDFDNTVINGDITLYAKWERKEMVATLIYGPDFNSALKGLAGTDTWPDSLNNNIKYFEKTDQIPEGVTTRLISTTNSDLPVYARFDVTNGTIYYYTDADKIYAPESMRYMFNGLTVLKNLDLSEWDTSKTTSMRTLFQHCYELESVDMSGWNTSNVTDMSFMFNRCNSLKELDLKNFDTSKVTEMRSMFAECNTLEELDLSSFDTSKVTTMRSMFMGVNSDMNLKSLNISSFNTKNVTNMRAMFQKCSSLTGLDLRNFDTSNVNDMAYMFTSCRSLEHLDVSSFDTSNVTTMTVMFGECPNLVELDVGDFDTTNVTDMSYMFYGLKKLQSLDVSNFHTTNVTNMFGMFAVCSELTELDLSKWDTNKVKNISNMFYGSVNLETVYASEKFNTSNVTADESIFLGNKFLVGGNGTVYDEERLNKEYAKIDILGQTGYFTDPNKITVNFISEGELYTGRIAVRSGQVEKPSENPSKSGLVFTNWYEDSGLNTVFDFNKGIVKYTELYAGFGEPQQVGGHSGGGGSTISKDYCPNGDFSDSYYDGICGENPKDSSSQTTQNDGQTSQDDEQTSQDDGGSNELQTAYEFAYENKITTMETIEKADMEGNLTRIAMAKMLSQYAINVLGKTPDITRYNKFADVSDELNTQYDNGVTLAYQLGIMGINMPSNKFRPYGYVTRAEFATALSRLLYQISDGEYEKTNKYYVNHMNKLLQEKIITVTDPNMKELRGCVMLMLMRSAK